MDQNELDYYFGANNINSSPEYEIIDLPKLSVVAETNQQKNTETVSFVAFNRFVFILDLLGKIILHKNFLKDQSI